VIEVHIAAGNLRAFRAASSLIQHRQKGRVRFGSTDKGSKLVDIERKQPTFLQDRNRYYLGSETYDTITMAGNYDGEANDLPVMNLSVASFMRRPRLSRWTLPASVVLKVVESGKVCEEIQPVRSPSGKVDTGPQINGVLCIDVIMRRIDSSSAPARADVQGRGVTLRPGQGRDNRSGGRAGSEGPALKTIRDIGAIDGICLLSSVQIANLQQLWRNEAKIEKESRYAQ